MAALGLIGATALADPTITKENTPPLSEWISGNGLTGTWGGLREKIQDPGSN
jgi:hypothetical protein